MSYIISQDLLDQWTADGNPHNLGVDPNPADEWALLKLFGDVVTRTGPECKTKFKVLLYVGPTKIVGRWARVEKYSFLIMDVKEAYNVRDNPEFIDAIRYPGNPNGVKGGEIGDYCCDPAAKILYKKTTNGGYTGWVVTTEYD